MKNIFPQSLESLLDGEQCIGGIPLDIVDPNHYVLPLWFNYFENNPAQLVHVDAHSDMNDVTNVGYLQDKESKSVSLSALKKYALTVLNEGNFICPAVFLGLLRQIIHFDPREDMVEVYLEKGRKNLPIISLNDKVGVGLYWDETDGSKSSLHLHFPLHIQRKKEKSIEKINEASSPLLLDIDLDAFECCNSPNESPVSSYVYERRLEKTFHYLREIKKPKLITIARSQKPYRYVPAHRVDAIQKDVLRGLRELYT